MEFLIYQAIMEFDGPMIAIVGMLACFFGLVLLAGALNVFFAMLEERNDGLG